MGHGVLDLEHCIAWRHSLGRFSALSNLSASFFNSLSGQKDLSAFDAATKTMHSADIFQL